MCCARRAAGHEVTVLVRDPSRLPGDAWPAVAVHTGDLAVLCPGPMVEEPPLGQGRLRISLDSLPVRIPPLARALPGPLLLPIFAGLVPRMTVPYADAAALMLAHLEPATGMTRRRVGLALPEGMRGRKPDATPGTGRNAP